MHISRMHCSQVVWRRYARHTWIWRTLEVGLAQTRTIELWGKLETENLK
jgi:hypothetical protein